MKKRPAGRKFRNLYARGGAIYFERVIGDRRIRFSTKTSNWEEAAATRDEYEQKKGLNTAHVLFIDPPTFESFSKRYTDEDTGHLADTTRSDRDSYLRTDGPLLGFFGKLPLDEIETSLIRIWWNQEVLGAERSPKTGKCYLDVLSAVLGYAVELKLLSDNPVPAFRVTLRKRSRTKKGRAASDPGEKIHPIEDPDEIQRIVNASKEESTEAHLLVLLLIDGGLRLGEALGLRWGAISWGDHEHDPRRSLLIDQAKPRGGTLSSPKSGRRRKVGLSRRLRVALAEMNREKFQPGPSTLVLGDLDPDKFRAHEWRRILTRARLAHRPLKDLRDTFASWLLTSGVQLGYVSAQLGHSDVSVTARHYSRWVGGDDVYRPPIALELGEIPADLLARLADSPQSPPTFEDAEEEVITTSEIVGEIWRAGRDSNPRPSGSKPDALSS
jgi:integrase